jgi:hypothetical protein
LCIPLFFVPFEGRGPDGAGMVRSQASLGAPDAVVALCVAYSQFAAVFSPTMATYFLDRVRGAVIYFTMSKEISFGPASAGVLLPVVRRWSLGKVCL